MKEKTCWALDTYRLSRISPGTMITLGQGKDKDTSTSNETMEIFWVKFHESTDIPGNHGNPLFHFLVVRRLPVEKQHNHIGQFVYSCLWKSASLFILYRTWTRLAHPLSHKASVSWGAFDSSGSFTTLKKKKDEHTKCVFLWSVCKTAENAMF